ncbi:hypothetical protein AA21291_2317 [Swaminathania salitolerans LMG 21291]|uniref:Uncharacterized protein n=1 Tax=Swaminathania salitolerans TaxID=182838 RepID=A0A511BMF9_9PROT|nr:hypothetical protein AA21291_2317 [Swaminathania salitolerans LMG 21291]GEL01506.1 hypothetical protein SSA02_06690 [Swaminathania salitolerans]
MPPDRAGRLPKRGSASGQRAERGQRIDRGRDGFPGLNMDAGPDTDQDAGMERGPSVGSGLVSVAGRAIRAVTRPGTEPANEPANGPKRDLT